MRLFASITFREDGVGTPERTPHLTNLRAMARFPLGINYWPRSSAMYAWQRFDLGEIREDMARIKSLGLDVVRFFLLWEQFQPHPDVIDEKSLRRFESVMAAIHDAGLQSMPTLFCGHMSGVNWLPAWTLDPDTPHGRFRTVSGGSTSPYGIGDFYADPHLLRAQTLFAHRIAERVRDHPALYAWDLGNEFSNLREPATPQDAAAWSVRLTETLIEFSNVGATGGLHGEDLERDRHIRPSSIAKPWSFATMHGYPVYSAFARDRMDPNVVSFLMQVTQSCSGKRVLFSELGNPQCPPGNDRPGGFACLDEHEMARYAHSAIDRLQKRGSLGAFWWCWADYALALADLPPFDQAPHELHFGIVRADGSFKPVAEALSRFASEARAVVEPQPAIVNEAAYYAALPPGIFDEYRTYCALYH
jgi:endo-1,4-beta-mannosidase